MEKIQEKFVKNSYNLEKYCKIRELFKNNLVKVRSTE